MFNIEEQLKKLPDKPGVYLMKDKKNQIIYVGKSKSLKKRVSQYFRSSYNHPPKVRAMVKSIEEFEYIITDNEVEALILEANLIKKHRPRYNVLLRDDKSYPYIKITTKEDYPRVLKTRNIINDGSRYFGPYINVDSVNQTLSVLEELFPLRKCKRDLSNKNTRPCLNFHIKRCLGPCTGRVNHKEYLEMVDEIILYLSGKQDILIKELQKKMDRASRELEFERAAKYRDQINALSSLAEKQKVISNSALDQDFISMAREDDNTCVMIFFIRDGKLIGREQHILEETSYMERGEILNTFLIQFYSGSSFVPKEIYIDEDIEDTDTIEKWLSQKRGSKVVIRKPLKGEKRKLMELVHKNALEYITKFEDKIKKEKEASESSLLEVKNILGLDKIPIRIEAYDISNIYGVFSVGSMVVFENGKELKSGYRRFKVRTIEGPNDYGSIQEILYRRFKKGIEELELIEKKGLTGYGKFSYLPDLVLIDGGRGHVSAAEEVLDALKLQIPIAGMVKDDKHNTKSLYYNNEEIILDKRSFGFKLIAKIQDEVHRFAISYHRTLRDKSMVQSILDEIKGIGDKRKIKLLKHFGSIERIRNASLEELSKVDGMNIKVAQSVYEFFRKKDLKY